MDSKNFKNTQESAKSSEEISIIFLAAGISSRFGGKIKQFAIVGKNGETLIEISMQQAKEAGFDNIVFVVGEKTEAPFREKFKNEWRGLEVKYAKQTFNPSERDRPWGTVDALLSIQGIVKGDFAMCNGDDIYGVGAFKMAHDFLAGNKEGKCVAIGYDLLTVLPESGTTNRGIFSIDKENNVTGINEVLNISKSALEEKNLKGNELASMNLFGLRNKVLPLLKKRLEDFKNSHKGDRKSECYIPVELGELCKNKEITMALLKTTSKWLGVTNPGDELIVKEALLEKH